MPPSACGSLFPQQTGEGETRPHEGTPSWLRAGREKAKLVRYICKQQQCRLSVAPGERTSELNSYPRVSDWLCTFNVRPVVVQEILSELTLDALLDMNEVKVKETLRRYGANAEECSRLQYALACLRKVTGLGGEHKEDSGWSSLDARRESSSGPSADALSPASLPWPPGGAQLGRMGGSTQGPRSVSVSALPTSDSPIPGPCEGLSDTSYSAFPPSSSRGAGKRLGN